MCGCSVKITDSNNLQSGSVGIPLNGIIKDDFAANLSWAWCINSDKVISAFKNGTGLDISAGDLQTLITANQNGNDVKVYKVNFNDLLKKIVFTQVERDNAACQVSFITNMK